MPYPKFGPAGAGQTFYGAGLKHSYQMPEFLKNKGLTAFEYQCGHGVRISDEKAVVLGQNARECGIALSLHAPYYISLVTREAEKMEKNLNYFLQSVRAARMMGAGRIVFHPGGVNKQTREEAWNMAKEGLAYIIKELDKAGYGDIHLCPETMGKINQMGDLEETIGFCCLHEMLIPCLDLGHLNSRMQGGLAALDAYESIMKVVENRLGGERSRNLHCHFSKIEYGTSGEKRHLTFEDTQYGPEFEPFIELLYKKRYFPVIICESAGTQTEDAKTMADYYQRLAAIV